MIPAGKCIRTFLVASSVLLTVSCDRDDGMIDVSFDVDVSVRGTQAVVTVTPSSSSVTYFFDSFSDDFVESLGGDFDAAVASYVESLFSFYASLGFSRQGAMRQFASHGPDSYTYDNHAYTPYTAFACALDPATGKIASDIAKVPYRTEGVLPSGNVISISTLEVGSRNARIRFEPSCDDIYMTCLEPASGYEGMTDDEIRSALIAKYSGRASTHHTAYTMSADTLSHSTSYSAFAFGVSSGVATTPLFRCDFRTVSVDMTMRVWVEKYFVGDDVIAAYPGKYDKAAGKAIALVRGEAAGSYTRYYYDAYYYYDGYDDPRKLSDAAVVATLKLPDKGTVTDTPAVYMAMEWGADLIFFGFAEDGAGERSDVCRLRFSPTVEESSPVSEFPD